MFTGDEMEIFEIHITGDKSILSAATELGLKTITIDLLTPRKEKMRQEFMTSQIEKKENYQQCREYVKQLVESLKAKNVQIIRVKIESPDYAHYRAQSLYMESHFEALDSAFPMSQNVRKSTILATDREYSQAKYDDFHERYADKELELCLYDSFVEEDKDWFDLYN